MVISPFFALMLQVGSCKYLLVLQRDLFARLMIL